MSKFCHHCKSELVNKDGRFCFSCYKPQPTEGSEANQDEIKQPSNDTDPKQNASNRYIPPVILAKLVTRIPAAIQLDKTLRKSKERDVDINVDRKDRNTLKMRDQLMTDLEYKVHKWWKSSEYTCEVLQDRDHMYVFAEIIQSLDAVFRSYREEHDSEVTQEMMNVGDKLNNLDRILSFIVFSVLFIGFISFMGIIVWLVTGAKEEGPGPKIMGALLLTFVVGMLILLPMAYYFNSVNKKMGKYKRKFQKGLFSALQQRVSEINEMKAVSQYIYVLLFDECEWIAYALNDENKAKAEVKGESATDIVVRIFVFSLDGNRFKSLYAPDCRIPEGTIYSEANADICIAMVDNYNN